MSPATAVSLRPVWAILDLISKKKGRGGGRGGKNHCGLEIPMVTNVSVILPFF